MYYCYACLLLLTRGTSQAKIKVFLYFSYTACPYDFVCILKCYWFLLIVIWCHCFAEHWFCCSPLCFSGLVLYSEHSISRWGNVAFDEMCCCPWSYKSSNNGSICIQMETKMQNVLVFPAVLPRALSSIFFWWMEIGNGGMQTTLLQRLSLKNWQYCNTASVLD